MPRVMSRRDALLRSALLLPVVCTPACATAAARAPTRPASMPTRSARLAELEQESGGRLGVAVLDSASGVRFGQRESERFPLCSTFKLLAVAAVLARVDRGEERLDRRIAYGSADLLEYAPVTRARLAEGGMPLSDLCQAAICVSDNTAGNLILATYGGPVALTRYVRTLGDALTRLDRNEPMLNEGAPGDERDTTTPAAMLTCMRALLLGEALSIASRERLKAWLLATTTGDKRLRAGVPKGWRVGDKTGTADHGSSHDVGILWPPGKPPLLVAAYLYAPGAAPAARDAILAEVGRLAATG
jgi:beta-lactamase class A